MAGGRAGLYPPDNDPSAARWRYRPEDFPAPPAGALRLHERTTGMPGYPVPKGWLDPVDEAGLYTENDRTGLLHPNHEAFHAQGLGDWDVHGGDDDEADAMGDTFDRQMSLAEAVRRHLAERAGGAMTAGERQRLRSVPSSYADIFTVPR